jgi:hypothetical protein
VSIIPVSDFVSVTTFFGGNFSSSLDSTTGSVLTSVFCGLLISIDSDSDLIGNFSEGIDSSLLEDSDSGLVEVVFEIGGSILSDKIG